MPGLTVLLTFPCIGKILFAVNQASQQQFSFSVTWERGEADIPCLGRNKGLSVQREETSCTSTNHKLHTLESFILLMTTLRITPVQQGLFKCSWLQGFAQGKQAENLQKMAGKNASVKADWVSCGDANEAAELHQ